MEKGLFVITSKEELRQNMVVANQKQKELLNKRDILLKNKTPKDKENALKLTHEIAELRDFIQKAEKTLRSSD